MKYYLKDILPRLKKYSASLDQQAFLVDKPWVVSDNGDKFEKLIFKRDGSVILSTYGDVTIGKWEYLVEAQSLLIDYGGKKKLYKHQYLDEAVLALKIDGPDRGDESYYLLANENVVQNLDVKHYLKKKYYEDENINLLLLDDGYEVEIENYTASGEIKRDSSVTIDGVKIDDGVYYYHNGLRNITIENGLVINRKKKVQYQNDIYVWITNQIPVVGDKVEGINSGSFKINTGGNYTILVENGLVSNVKYNVFEEMSNNAAIAMAVVAIILLILMILKGI